MVRCAVCRDKLDEGILAVDVIWCNRKFYHRECYARVRGDVGG